MCALLSSHARRSAEFKATLAGGLAADWENKEVQKLATEHYNEMDKMGNANGLLEVRRRADVSVHTCGPRAVAFRR